MVYSFFDRVLTNHQTLNRFVLDDYINMIDNTNFSYIILMMN